MKKYCWLNTATGEFSTSWENRGKIFSPKELIKHHKESKDPDKHCWKLIEFECLTDKNFEFTDKMKLR